MPKKKTSLAFIPKEILAQTTQTGWYSPNGFFQNLINNVPFPFTDKEIKDVFTLYNLGTILEGYRLGAVTFPFIDENCGTLNRVDRFHRLKSEKWEAKR